MSAMSRINGDRRVRRVRFQVSRVRVPLWMLLLAVTVKGLVLGVRWCWRHRVAVPVALGLVLFVHRFGWLGLVTLLAGLVLVGAVWWRSHPRSFGWFVWWARGRARLAFVYRRRWRPAMVHSGLAIRKPTSNADQVIFDEYFPRIRGIRSTPDADVLRVELLPGQTPDEWAARAEALRHVFRARSCEARAETYGFIRLRFRRHGIITHPAASGDFGPPEAAPIPSRRSGADRPTAVPPMTRTAPRIIQTNSAQSSTPVTGGWIPDLSPYMDIEAAGSSRRGSHDRS